MAATFRAILGQIIKLTKSIALQEPIDKKGFKLEFIARIPRLEMIGIGPTLTLWKTEGSFQAIKNIARMIRFCHPEAVDCDTKTIEGLTMKTIEDLVLNENIFRADYILASSQKCLADCRVDQNINEFSNKIYSQLMTQVRTSINDWCNVIGVPRVMCDSFDIPQAHIALISRMDTKKWEEVVSAKYKTNKWSHLIGCIPNSGGIQLFGFECRSLIVHQAHGTQLGTKFSSRLEFAKFFAVLYATVTVEEDMRLLWAREDPYRWCIQFPSLSSSGLGTTQSELDEAVFPFFCADFKLSHNAVKSIQNWYLALENSAKARRARIEKACHFANRGIMTNGLDSYVNFFISLDALYGEAGGVEGSIQRGIESLPIDISLKKRVSWLHNLRNELVHGGSRFCAEWRDYDRYYLHFRTMPEEDIKRISCIALLNSVST
jgi:hypothetical protein